VLRRRKHWGWGFEDQQPPREQVEGIARAVTDRLGFEVDEIEEPVALDAVELRESRLRIPKRFEEMFSDERYDRLSHALGKAYRDVVRGFRGDFPSPPDLVAYPESPEDVDIVLNYCADEKAAAIPYGGGTSVVGGVEPRITDDYYRGAVSIDLRRMDRVLQVDPISMAAQIQAGATGPRLEEQLREHGLTLRHFPQSFEYSTLGGWIATRAGGHFATLYTHIDDLVESIRAVTLEGDWESRRLPGP
jgi:alkyldihydroxyacetonephosphate synthase